MPARNTAITLAAIGRSKPESPVATTMSGPAALLIVSQLGMGALLGMLGLLLAAPLLVAAMVTVQVLYVRDVLEEPVRVLGAPEESAGRRGRARSGRAKEEPT